MQADVREFFDPATYTYSYIVTDPATQRCAIVDSVLDYDPASGRTSCESADRIIAYVKSRGLKVDWLLETHAHADHLSAAPLLQARVGGRLIDRELEVRPSIRLGAGAPVRVMITRDLILEPYRR